MESQINSLIRTLLKIGGTVLVTKGYTDDATVEAAVGAICTLVGIGLSVYHHYKTKGTANEQK